MVNGRCECGDVTFEVESFKPEVAACHCGQCRRTSGHYWASSFVPDTALKITNDAGLKWYESSSWAKRGFCQNCGSSLFYKMHSEDGVAVSAGCFDDDSGVTLAKHIFVKDKGSYYEIADGKPQLDTH